MSTISIILVLLSSVTHAGWNLLSKKDNSSISYFFVGNIAAGIIFSPILFFYHDKLSLIPDYVWVLLILTGFFEALYYSTLAYGYRLGEMSLVYPIARALPIIMVTIYTVMIGKASDISHSYIIGCLFIVVGLFILPLEKITKETLKSLFTKSIGFAFVAAIGTAAYSVIDDKALRILNEVPDQAFSSLEASLIFMVFIALFSSVWLGIFTLFSQEERKLFREIMENHKKNATIMGLGIYVSYGIILLSMLFASNVAYVVAFRQVSIPIGTLFGYFILKESMYLLKIIGTFLTVLGLIVIAIS
ncbi:EamA-like transporter family protein [Desulfonispora thiosulfatigenes DSM 11270]|uniref:EamA-like transporter family protein n=1 Tax=Desulfonispora thiosulfatigenes DSM 11270 TaxID=656914 RepID=A0A1W1UKK1_DESTI|nr:EamA family transporter [Desulfonispora thiosulfatigenes]SMB81648.1 EamA-like transporter family protein [Desulfonispora thiosulfatigenes DSM 11270]